MDSRSGTGRAKRADAEANLVRILGAAEHVFAEHGSHASIALVAKRARVGLGTIYRHFPDKDALVAELARRLLVDVVELAEKHVTETDGSGLFEYMNQVSELLVSSRGSVARMWSDPAVADLVARSRAAQGRLLAKAQAQGLVRDDLVPEDVAVTLWSVHGVIDVAGDAAPDAWRRHVSLIIAGWMNRSAPVPERALTDEQMLAVIVRSPGPSDIGTNRHS